ncbi:sulfite exporter TauE/SafE family protein [Limimaricola hongkongensis]|uniref:Probable membrane transporter protein n=1 Tax=Limimaricola hongkongensis DSM 17492 TaxID=1122180 RepID=A0A017HF96_9RHOB|nr:sulfite exporter TauE/SafE family protein [Limimaricola hongkongensis]EYD73016.1 Membrane protein, putative [Limimaricola hongkongensis DSM 17492]
MIPFAELMSPQLLLLSVVVGIGAGIVKGMVGFAMPMIMISSLSLFLPPELALAALIAPTLVTNGMQALRQGGRAALSTVKRFRVYLIVGGLMLVLSAQLVRVLSAEALFLLIGAPVSAFAILQLSGWKPKIPEKTGGIEAAIGGFSGFVGGMSGVWGPPTVAYLTAIDTPKGDSIRAQGVIYGLGALALSGAHLQSGVLNDTTLPFSLFMILPAMAGMWLGGLAHDRIDQKAFRHVTLIVLLVAGLNLVRRAIF